jgi:RNA polymerase sigma-70 factor (ECF subfamily)
LKFPLPRPIHAPEELRVIGDRGDEDGQLLARCKAGDRAAWRTLYESHFDFVLRTARQLGTPQEEVEDVAQEVFTVVMRKLDQFEIGKVSTWIYRICATIVADRHRRRRVRRALAHFFGRDEAHHQTPERELQSQEASREVSRILEGMGAKKREVFVLFELEGLTGLEITERIGCKLETVWTRLFHARRDFSRLAQQRRFLETTRSEP